MPTTGLSISNTFNTESGQVPAQQLDTNFSQLAAAYNSLLSYANYYQDTGAVNAMVITAPSPLLVSYAAGLPLQVLVGNTNTGAVTLNVNNLGATAVVNPGGGNLTAGQLQAGTIAPMIFDGSVFQFQGPVSAITPSGAANLVYATPNGSAGGASLRTLVAADFPSGNVTLTAGSFTGTLLGVAGTVTGAINYRIVSNGTQSICTLYTPTTLLGTSNANSMNISGLPGTVNPAVPQFHACAVSIASTILYASVQVGSSFLTFNLFLVSGSNISGVGNFPTSGSKGLPQGWSITYALA